MKYLTSKQEEALSPVKREVYKKRLMRDLERRHEEIIRDWGQVPKGVPIDVTNCTMWLGSSRLQTLAAALAIKQQYQERFKNEIVSLHEES